MAKFVWHLQRVLDVKKKQAQATRMELLHLTEQVAQVRDRRALACLIGMDLGCDSHRRDDPPAVLPGLRRKGMEGARDEVPSQ